APTGRAAKRLGEATGEPSSTLHRLLEYSFQRGGFQFGDERPLDTDWLVVDEASMIDTYLMSAIARALPDHARLLLVGDVDQLPSVGPGNVLADIMESGGVEVVRLTEIFRQARQSNIVLNAHRINRGELPEAPRRSGEELVDFYAIEVQEPAATRERILHMVCERIPKAFGYDAIDDVQILSPMHKGEVGCRMLNEVLQERFNPGAKELVRGPRRFKVGDKVMQQRNNYDLDVFNGDTGRITRIDEAAKSVTVTYDDQLVGYEFSQLDELELAYAITVHKSQGSEYPCVVLPVVTQHFIMLQRNLLYTAITRARELVILIGTQRAVGIAVRNTDARSRYTRLVERLREAAQTSSMLSY
ncbi:MAG: AAA family ATPase, partial [Myxococcota bacterium]